MNVLFIPHVPNLRVVNRVYEFAKHLDAYFLYWEIDNSSLIHKIKSQFNSLKYTQKERIVQIPLLFKPEVFAVKLNTLFLNLLIDKLNIDAVINANALLFDIKSIKVPVIYDLVDDHLEINESIGLNEKRVAKIKEDIKSSTGVVCVSEFLEKKVKALNPNTITIENGLYFEKFDRAKSLKAQLGLEGKKVFGYIGGVEKWTGIDRAIEQYLKAEPPNSAFLVVGGSKSSFFQELKRRYQGSVHFIGQVSPEEVAHYFKTIDVGLIPFELNEFTNNALPIKALEYGYAKKPVLSTPLAYLQHKKFPFVHFCEIEKFYECMKKDLVYEPFDFSTYSWRYLSQRLYDFIKESV